jgi:thioredoxin reductase (NADPH)
MTSLQRFFVRNIYPHRIVELPAEARGVTVDESSLPTVTLSSGSVLTRPTITELADELGITELPTQR